MSALENQYWACYQFYTEYKEKYLHNDIQMWEARHNCNFYFRFEDIADIRSELKVLLFADIKKKFYNNDKINNTRNYVFTVCKNDLKNILIKISRLRKNKSQYEHEWKIKMIDANNRKKGDLLATLDEYSYVEVRELFMSALDIREMAVVYLVHSGFNYDKIARTLKISVDYCRKIYNQAENKLRDALGL